MSHKIKPNLIVLLLNLETNFQPYCLLSEYFGYKIGMQTDVGKKPSHFLGVYANGQERFGHVEQVVKYIDRVIFLLLGLGLYYYLENYDILKKIVLFLFCENQ